MASKIKFGAIIGACLGLVAVIAYLLMRPGAVVLHPMGAIGVQQSHLMLVALLLMLVVVLPVFVMTFWFAWHYREGNLRAKYTPEWGSSRRLETIWWGVPCLIILALAIITWQSSHTLDPYKPIASATKPLKVQVVALQWKWLFIYPEQGIASVNELAVPAGTPVDFDITADAPMNSFWIPQLGGQVYAMSGMTTQLHLVADQTGTYDGSSANISGQGFADMRFKVRALSPAGFEAWTARAAASPAKLTQARLDELTKPSKASTPLYFASPDQGLYDNVIMKYMGHGHE